MWVRAMEVYGRIAKDVEPKRKALASSMKELMKTRTLTLTLTP